MAAVIGNAFSGFAKSVTGINKEPKSSHQTFIETKLLPHTVKLQKETAWGRYKVSFTNHDSKDDKMTSIST